MKKFLPKLLGFEFLDTDEIIEKQQNSYISEIFDKYGEIFFRNLEREIIANISVLNGKIIATGGGCIQNIENLKNLKKNGFVIYLKAKPEELYKRIKEESHRPLLKNSNPLTTLQNLLEKREKNYMLADFVVDTQNKIPQKIAEEITKVYYDKFKY